MTRRWAALALLVLALAACGEASSPRPAAPAPVPTPSAHRPTSTTVTTALARGAAPPVRIRIPAIGVSAAVVRLGLNRDGTLQVPADFGVTGWFTGGPAPGETGPAVIAGHIDSRRGPAVFYRLHALRPGDRVAVERADGTTVQFAVEGSAQYPKRAFPTEAVFGPSPDPLLRLITCGGAFDRSTRHYRDNVVVTARLASA
ncbi:MAG TPA: class F sortase [Actinomycetes bacterium]|nr:class F sortase [Actinomycetes bacterium]